MTFLPCKVRTTWYIHVLCSLSFVGMISWTTCINLHVDGKCRRCSEHDTLIHRITGCGDTRTIWEWTRSRVASYLRVDTTETWRRNGYASQIL
jgi:hypothetical protein